MHYKCTTHIYYKRKKRIIECFINVKITVIRVFANDNHFDDNVIRIDKSFAVPKIDKYLFQKFVL